eukprot:gene22719-25736_t
MSFPVIRHAALTSLAMAMAAPSFAQIIVSDAVIVTATRSAQLQRDVLSDVVTLQAEDIARSGAGSITDLLQRQRGIEIARNGGPGTNSSVYLRGANANQTVVLVDGVRIGSITSGTASWSGIPLQAIERIEIVYGPMSTLYGADAIGGVALAVDAPDAIGAVHRAAQYPAGADLAHVDGRFQILGQLLGPHAGRALPLLGSLTLTVLGLQTAALWFSRS